MLAKKKCTVMVASKAELTNTHYSKRLWLAARNISISRRQWPDVIANAVYGFDGDILLPDGRLFPIPEIDDVLGDPRWFSYYFEELDGNPRRPVRLIERLRVIDLYFRIVHPNIARHFGR